MDQFLTELERRLDFLEDYGNLSIDTGFSRAYATLQTVRTKCSQISGDMLDAGMRRAIVIVDTVESRYQDALAAKEGFHDKVYSGILFLDDMLSDFETRAYKVRAGGLSGLMDEGRRVMDEGIEQVQRVMDESVEKAKHAVVSVEEHIAAALARAREHGLISYEDLPVPWRVNPHITKGYRFTPSKIDCLYSLVHHHNESVNIWSHLMGLLLVLVIAFNIYPASIAFARSVDKMDVFIAAVFFFAACKCLACSCLWHTMNSVADQSLMERFACVDYTGISLLIAASIMTTEYTAFYCEPVSRAVYLGLTATLGIGGVILPWHPTFNRVDMAWARVAFYVSLAMTGFAPVIQLSATRSSAWAWSFYAPLCKSGAVYLLGAIIYATQMPECIWPGAFNYIGGSHNWWHFAVLGGILFHYVAMVDLFAMAYRRAETECTF